MVRPRRPAGSLDGLGIEEWSPVEQTRVTSFLPPLLDQSHLVDCPVLPAEIAIVGADEEEVETVECDCCRPSRDRRWRLTPTKGGRMAFRFELKFPDGEDAGDQSSGSRPAAASCRRATRRSSHCGTGNWRPVTLIQANVPQTAAARANATPTAMPAPSQPRPNTSRNPNTDPTASKMSRGTPIHQTHGDPSLFRRRIVSRCFRLEGQGSRSAASGCPPAVPPRRSLRRSSRASLR
jgi:hypothetical protein